MKSRTLSVIMWLVAGVFVTAAAVYVIWSDTPESMINRIQFVVLAAAAVGIPLGIQMGTQEKFWT